MGSLSSQWAAFLEYERNFQGQVWIDYTRDHSEIPVFVVSVYLAMVFYLPSVMEANKLKWELRNVVVAWNTFLAVFSIIGVTRTVPHLFHALWTQSFEYTVCKDPRHWYLNGPPGLWVGLFIFSKVPELIDTLFLVLRARKVIFLHWFHHCTVLLYCWHAYHHRIAPGLWFACMNYAVHSIMYTYYALMAARLHWLVTPFASMITSAQILQMAVGAYVIGSSAQRHLLFGQDTCYVDPANYKLGLAMYLSYFGLFASLFWSKYIDSRCCAPRQPSDGPRTELCGVNLQSGDATGRFNDGLGIKATGPALSDRGKAAGLGIKATGPALSDSGKAAGQKKVR